MLVQIDSKLHLGAGVPVKDSVQRQFRVNDLSRLMKTGGALPFSKELASIPTEK